MHCVGRIWYFVMLKESHKVTTRFSEAKVWIFKLLTQRLRLLCCYVDVIIIMQAYLIFVMALESIQVSASFFQSVYDRIPVVP
jgi:hypothetical protein